MMASGGGLPVPGSAAAWVMACRPPTLTAAFVPVAVGTACAYQSGGVAALPALAAWVGATLIQIGSNFANDVFDFEKGADTEGRLGPMRAVQGGLLTPAAVRRAMVFVFGLALLVGVYLTTVAGPSIVLIGLLSIVSAVAYTGGPYPLGYHGLGDVFVMLFFGHVAVGGTAFVQVGHVPVLALWAGTAVGALATAILVVNNIRDRQTDVEVGKRTLPVRFGLRFGQMEYVTLVALAYAVPATLAVSGRLGPTVLLPLLSLPLALARTRRVLADTGAALNASLIGTAKLLFVYGCLLALGIALSP